MLQIALAFLLAAQPPNAGADDTRAREAPLVVAQASEPEGTAGSANPPAPPPTPTPPIYQAPRTGQPRGRIAGITRGSGDDLPRPLALAPGHVAETTRARPKLYWSIDRPHAGRVMFALSSRDAVEPECEIALPSPTRAGSGVIDLAACPSDLATGTEYEWFVAVVIDPAHRALDHVAQGWIRRVAAPADLDAERASAADLAGRGLWYDALQRAAEQGDRAAWRRLMNELSITSIDPP
jgi:hypothetical protein